MDRYAELQRGLAQLLPADTIDYGFKVLRVEPLGADADVGALRVSIDSSSSEHVDCDLVVAADGPRSALRRLVAPAAPSDLRFAGYAAWRGTVALASLPHETKSALEREYKDLGNCLYFVWAKGRGGDNGSKDRAHAVLYDIGNGLINWLVYTNRDTPAAEPGRTTTAATEADIQSLRCAARMCWGEALGGVIDATPQPFMTDVYDLHEPLQSLSAPALGIVLLGDSAHAMTPHMAKGKFRVGQPASFCPRYE